MSCVVDGPRLGHVRYICNGRYLIVMCPGRRGLRLCDGRGTTTGGNRYPHSTNRPVDRVLGVL